MLLSLLNRWRGTGDIFIVHKLRITGVVLYTLFFLILFSLLLNVYYGVLLGILFVLGESYAWGTWVSYLCYPENHPKEYDSKVGRSFPYIHYQANLITPQLKDYAKYCYTALTLRGFYWWLPIYLVFAYAGVISYVEAFIISVLLGVAFPLACNLGQKIQKSYSYKYFSMNNNWEKQEVVYGIFHEIALWYVILQIIFKG